MRYLKKDEDLVVERKSVEDGISYIGPDLSVGPMPTVIYFSLSDKDSLETDPFNQFPLFCVERKMRVFSFMLPGHEESKRPTMATDLWLHDLKAGNDVIEKFLQWVTEKIKQYIPEKRLALAGLSRGVFMALHLAARLPIRTVIGFAPMLRLQEEKIHSLSPLLDALSEKTIRFYAGNRDTLISTDFCFSFVRQLTEHAFSDKHIRSPPIELLITPSIGRYGHGTKKQIFEEGSEWIKEQIMST